jgi:hypothetical protein
MMVNASQIRERMEVVDKAGKHVGTVDHMEGSDQIKLAKSDAESGGRHRFVPLSAVDRIESDKICLSKSKDELGAGTA